MWWLTCYCSRPFHPRGRCRWRAAARPGRLHFHIFQRDRGRPVGREVVCVVWRKCARYVPCTGRCLRTRDVTPSALLPVPPPGDKTKVTIGRGSCVQDRAVVDGAAGVTTIGNDVTIGAGAFVGGATISDGVLVGPGAKVLAGAHVGSDSYIDGGAVVTSGTRIPAGEVRSPRCGSGLAPRHLSYECVCGVAVQLWTGSPAAKLRNLTEGEIAYLRNFAQHTAEVRYLVLRPCSRVTAVGGCVNIRRYAVLCSALRHISNNQSRRVPVLSSRRRSRSIARASS